MSNIFDFAGQSSRKPKLSKKEIKAPPVSSSDQKEISKEEAGDMLIRMQSLRQELMLKVEGMYEQTGIQPENLKTFVEEVKEPSKEEYKAAKESLDERVTKALSLSLNRKKSLRKIKKEEGTRKGKTLGDRKKWIPVR